MLIPLKDLVEKYSMDVSGVVHVGAHEGQEAQEYRQLFGTVPVIWIEGDPRTFAKLQKAVRAWGNMICINSVVSDVDGEEVAWNVASFDQSSSILELGTHKTAHPEVTYVDSYTVHTDTLDSLSDAFMPMLECNFLNMDIQGAEGKAILGAEIFLKGVDYIYTEVNRDELYLGCMKLPEFDELLQNRGFVRRELFVYDHLGWGDALYIRE